ncbi:UNVERIFIED_CONTAM: hypothetical protein GTU68_012582, partial [Idotea baltica]|nr:hypothetical protein [Idotea baltica]
FFQILILSTSAKQIEEDAVSQSEELGCDPYAQCLTSGIGTQVPDPKDCHNYYVCVENAFGNVIPSDNPFACPDSSYFSRSNGTCIYDPNNYPCKNTCHQSCQLTCTTYELELIPYYGDCGKYLVCTEGGQTILVDCPLEKPYFDGNNCTNNEFLCCDTCTPFCESEFTEVLDPNDCRSYYFCSEGGVVPQEQDRFSCDEGFVFDPLIGECENGDSCSSVCPGNDNSTALW